MEIDKLKTIMRRSPLIHVQRMENDAEHSWHLAMAAMVLAEHAEEEVDLVRVIKMALVHDLVEIDAGDTYCYDYQAAKDKEHREQKAAERIFNLLPADQAAEFRGLWDEFEEAETTDAKFANALDRFVPVLHNVYTQGKSWAHHGIVREQVEQRIAPVAKGSVTMWNYLQQQLDEAVASGMLKDGRNK